MENIDLLDFKAEVARANLTLAAVCREAGVSRSTLSEVINNKRNKNLSIKSYNKLIDAYEKLKSEKE